MVLAKFHITVPRLLEAIRCFHLADFLFVTACFIILEHLAAQPPGLYFEYAVLLLNLVQYTRNDHSVHLRRVVH